VSSKLAKKSSKLDSFKKLVFGSSQEKGESGSTAKKKASSTPKSQSSKKASAGSKSKGRSKAELSDHDTKNAPPASEGDNAQVMQQQKTRKVDLAQGQTGSRKITASIPGRGTLESPAGEAVCREVACEGLGTSAGYCRLHYIKNWKKIKRKELILREKKLNQYIEELVAKYPDKYIEAIRQDLASDKDFAKVIYDLDLDEGLDDFDVEGGESVDSLIDSIRRDFDDEGEAF
jgi:hypothetical protein